MDRKERVEKHKKKKGRGGGGGGFFFNDTATTEIYTLSLHDALPIFLILAALIRPALWKLPQHRHTKPEKSDEDFTTSGSESSEHSSETTADIDKENPQ